MSGGRLTLVAGTEVADAVHRAGLQAAKEAWGFGKPYVAAPPYGPTVAELLKSLPEIGTRLQGAFEALAATPSRSAAEQLAIELDGARRACLLLGETIRRDGSDEQ